MENNVYTAPEAELIDDSNAQDAGKQLGEHYVLPQLKLWVFCVLSFGIFLLPWSYMHWRRIKQSDNSDIWPVPRAIFSVFFIHSLFTRFELSKVDVGSKYNWSLGTNAAFYIIFSVIGNLMDRIYESASMDIGAGYWVLFLCSWIIPIVTISNAQRVANIAVNDPQGETNSRWTVANFLWLGLCITFLALAAFGLYVES